MHAGALGVVAGMLGAMQLSSSMGPKTAVDAQSIVMAFTFASAIGVVFGAWPARRTSALDPLEALRHE